MADFKVIETQEQLDQIIKDRLERKESSVRKEFEGFISPEEFQSKIDEFEKQITSLNDKYKDYDSKSTDYESKIMDLESKNAELLSKNKAYELDSVKTRVALELGVPVELASRLTGETEEDIRKDASIFANFTKKQSMPNRNSEASNEVDGVTAAFAKLNPNLKL